MSAPIYNEAALRLDALRKRIIGELWEHPCYRALIDELKSRRPTVPYWKPAHVVTKRAKDGSEAMVVVPDNSGEMQAASAAQKWHDVVMAIINPNEKYEQANPKGKDE